MNKRPQDIPDELISAYLDGELTPEEKARVEDLLIDSPEHRRLFEELKALRASLQSLPNYHLADDFAAKVLKRAEREMLTSPVEESAEEGGAAVVPSRPAPPVVPTPAPEEQGGSWRVVVWSVAALAAALLVALVVPQTLTDFSKEAVRQLALEDQAASDAAAPAAEQTASEAADMASDGAGAEVSVDESERRVAVAERTDADADLAVGPAPAGSSLRDEEAVEIFELEAADMAPAAAEPAPGGEGAPAEAVEALSESLTRSAASAVPPASQAVDSLEGASLKTTDLVVSLEMPAERFRERLAENGIVYISAFAGPAPTGFGGASSEGGIEDSLADATAEVQVDEESNAAGIDAGFSQEEPLSVEDAESAPAENLRESDGVALDLADSAQGEARGEHAAGGEQWIVVEAPVEQVQRLLAQLGVEPEELGYFAEPDGLALRRQLEAAWRAGQAAGPPTPEAAQGMAGSGGSGRESAADEASEAFSFQEAEADLLPPGAAPQAEESVSATEVGPGEGGIAPQTAGVAYPISPPQTGGGQAGQDIGVAEGQTHSTPREEQLSTAGANPLRAGGVRSDAPSDVPEPPAEDDRDQLAQELQPADEPAQPVVRVFFRLQPAAAP